MEGGLLTGSKGPGAVTAGYFSVCESLGKIGQTLRATNAANAAREEQAASLLREMRAVTEDAELSVFERREKFRDLAARLLRLDDAAGNEKVAERIVAQFAIMKDAVVAIAARDGAFGERQLAAVEGLRASVASAGTALGKLAAPVETKTALPGELLQMNAAVLRYWPRFWQPILLACAVDFMAFYYVLLLSVSRAVMRARIDDIGS